MRIHKAQCISIANHKIDTRIRTFQNTSEYSKIEYFHTHNTHKTASYIHIHSTSKEACPSRRELAVGPPVYRVPALPHAKLDCMASLRTLRLKGPGSRAFTCCACSQCQVCFFAAAKDLTGTAELDLELPAGGAVGGVVETLRNRFPQLERLLPRCALAVNGEYIEAEHMRLADGDEVALLPPMSGG